MSQTLSFPMTREQLEADRAKAAAAGLILEGDSGTRDVKIPFGTVGVKYAYDGKYLTVEVTHKPRLLSESAIESKIKELLG